jgi:hypothetical protein
LYFHSISYGYIYIADAITMEDASAVYLSPTRQNRMRFKNRIEWQLICGSNRQHDDTVAFASHYEVSANLTSSSDARPMAYWCGVSVRQVHRWQLNHYDGRIDAGHVNLCAMLDGESVTRHK